MELNIYNWEKFERNKRRYTILAAIIIIVLWICIYYKNLTWFILIFIVLWWYIYLWLVNFKEIKLKITENWLILWDKIIPRTTLTWYVVEIDKETQQIKNIVLLSEKRHSVHTISDTPENIKLFLSQLDNFIPMVSEYDQTTREKLARILKL